jgi:propionyl-CoA synthetase
MQHVFNVSKGDVWFSTSDIGWVVGHSFIVYGPLIRRATTILFEGKPILPDAGVLWRVVEQYKVK